MPDVKQVSTLLITFKIKIRESLALVPDMIPEEKLKAAKYWNMGSGKMQEIMNSSAADISALPLENDEEVENIDQVPDETDVISTEKVEQTVVTTTNNATMSPPLQSAQPQLLMTLGNSPNVRPASAMQQSLNQLMLLAPQTMMANNRMPTPFVVYMPAQTLLIKKPQSTNSGIGENAQSNVVASADMATRILGSQFVLHANQGAPMIAPARTMLATNVLQANPDTTVKITGTLETTQTNAPGEVGKNSKLALKRVQKKTNPGNSGTDNENPSSVCEPNSNQPAEELGTKITKDTEPEELVESQDKSNDQNRVMVSILKSWEAGDKEPSSTKITFVSKKPNTVKKGMVRKGVGISDAKFPLRTRGKKGIVYPCTECNAVYKKKYALFIHSRKHTGERPYACSHCNATFMTVGTLNRHLKIHSGNKPWQCDQCTKCFTEKNNLKSHMKVHSSDKPWHCTQCSRSFADKGNLKIHLKRHTGDKPFQCEVCGRRFAQVANLQVHMTIHINVKELLCEQCGKSFRQKQHLRLHMMRHNSVFKNHKCNICPSRFLTKAELIRHIRVHTGERPYTCKLCERTFTRQQTLDEHLNRHYGRKPYKCKFCGKGFAELAARCKHMKLHTRERERARFLEHEERVKDQVLEEVTGLETDVAVDAIKTLDSEQEFIALVQEGEDEHVDITEGEIVIEFTTQD